MIAVIVALSMAQASLTSAETARNAFDPARLAAAHRLRLANDSEATLEARVRVAARELVLQETGECLKLSAANPRSAVDCGEVAKRQGSDMMRLPAALPALIDQMRQMEERAYAMRFTVEEMDTVSRFFESPVWQRFRPEVDPINREVTTALRLLLRTTLDGTPPPAEPSKDPS